VRVDGADGRRRTSGRATRRKMAHVFAGIAWAGAASGAPTKATANAKTQCYIGPVVNSGPYDGPLKILPYARFLLSYGCTALVGAAVIVSTLVIPPSSQVLPVVSLVLQSKVTFGDTPGAVISKACTVTVTQP